VVVQDGHHRVRGMLEQSVVMLCFPANMLRSS
jgi:hypothetical protein